MLPEAEEVDIDIHPNDLKIDVYRSSGPGGQSVNTTDSAVRITHPDGHGCHVSGREESAQEQGQGSQGVAIPTLEAKLAEIESERSEARHSQVSTGDRSAKIRTYNWPQGRVTDHRLEDDKNHALERVMGGELDDIIKALRTLENADHLASL